MRALTIAATGMSAQQLNVEVIANNIANINTTGFKRARAEFTDLLYQAERLQGVSNRGRDATVPEGAQIGLGVKTAAVYRINEQGNLQQTSNVFDLAIRGNTIERGGFFCPNWDSPQAGALSIVAEGTEGGLRPPGVFARIVIAGNTVRGTNGVNLVLASARGVEVTENRFLEAGRPAPPATGGRYQIDQRAVVWVGSCDQVVFRGNEVTVAAPSAGPALVLGPGATRIEAAAPDAFAESLRTNKP